MVNVLIKNIWINLMLAGKFLSRDNSEWHVLIMDSGSQRFATMYLNHYPK